MSEAAGGGAPGGLPDSLPIFPLPGVLLLPHGRLPLNVFEPRYLAMVRDALAGPRLIGMVQPERAEAFLAEEPGAGDPGGAPIYGIGCAGRIVSFSETDDGRYLVTLKGLIRFRAVEELAGKDGYRRVRPDFAPFAADLREPRGVGFDRERLLGVLAHYFEQQAIEADWESIQAAPDDRLVSSLAMVCPLAPAEKQALLEAPDLAARAETLTAVLEMALAEAAGGDGEPVRH